MQLACRLALGEAARGRGLPEAEVQATAQHADCDNDTLNSSVTC